MGMLILAGGALNAVARAGSLTCSPAADSSFPLSNIKDKRPGTIFKFGSIVADSTITVDLNVSANPGIETWSAGAPASWTVLTGSGGSVTEATGGNAHSGTSAVKVTNLAVLHANALYQDMVLTCGATYTIDFWYKNSVGGSAEIGLQNRDSLNWWNGGSNDWRGSQQTAFFADSAAYANGTETFTVENVPGQSTTTVRIYLYSGVSATDAYFDDVLVLASDLLSFSSWHGHNIGAGITVELRSSTDNFVANDVLRATATVGEPSFYVTFSGVNVRYWRTKFGGTQSSQPIYIGEWVLGVPVTLTGAPLYPVKITRTDPRIGGNVGVNGTYVYSLGAYPQRRLSYQFRSTASEFSQLLTSVYLASRGGTPVVVVPDTTESDVIYGRLAEEMMQTRTTLSISDVAGIDIAELPLPIITS